MSIAKNFAYPPITPGARARCSELVVFPVSGNTFAPGNVIRYAIPLNPRQCLALNESYQSFTITPTGGASLALDHSALSLFDRATAYSPNGQVLEDVIQCGRCMIQLFDAQVDQSVRTNGFGQMIGCAESGIPADIAAVIVNTTAVLNRLGLTIATGTATNLASPVPLGMFMASNRAYPAFAQAGGVLRIDLQLASANDALVGTNGTALNYSLTNVALRIPYVEFDDESIAMIKAAAGPKLHYPIFTWAHSSQTIAAAGTYSLPIGVRQRSVLYVHGGFYGPGKAAGSEASINSGNRLTNGITSLQTRIDGQMVPTQPLTTPPQFLAAIEQTFRDMSTVVKSSALANRTQYALTVATAGVSGSFMWAVDLRNQPESAAADAVFTGRNMSNSDVVLNFTIASANGTNVYTWWAHNRLMSVDALDGTTELIQ
jgi:hypothetical protein